MSEIPEDKVIEAMENRFDGIDKFDIAQKVLELEAELLTHQWVSVEDRLPNPTDEWEIELYDTDGVCREIASTQYINEKPVYLDSNRDEIEIATIKELYTHWKSTTLPTEKEGADD